MKIILFYLMTLLFLLMATPRHSVLAANISLTGGESDFWLEHSIFIMEVLENQNDQEIEGKSTAKVRISTVIHAMTPIDIETSVSYLYGLNRTVGRPLSPGKKYMVVARHENGQLTVSSAFIDFMPKAYACVPLEGEKDNAFMPSIDENVLIELNRKIVDVRREWLLKYGAK